MPIRWKTSAAIAVMTAATAVLGATIGAPNRTVPVAAAAPSSTSGLTPALATAYRQAKAQAQREGVPLWITSGKRSWAEQESMWRDGIATYGSPAAARRWVLPPAESTHVTGRAIDVGPQEGAQWLARKGPPGPVPHVRQRVVALRGRDRAADPVPAEVRRFRTSLTSDSCGPSDGRACLPRHRVARSTLCPARR